MYRSISEKLLQWKEGKSRKPLIIYGARQTGKTWIMREFGRKCFEKTAYISFYRNERAKRIFDGDFDISRLIPAMSIEADTVITPEDTLIVLDEIQDAPRAVEALKYFCEDAPQYAVVAAGSLLGVALHKGISFPVGKVSIANLYPMSYREYLKAIGEERLCDLLDTKDYELIDTFRDKYLLQLKNYLYVGGMPAVVDYYRENPMDYRGVRDIQNEIVKQYRSDFGKHTEEKQLPRINMVWDAIPVQLAKENKKFFFGKMKKGARSADFEVAIQWLIDSGLIIKVNKVSKPANPLKAYTDLNAYKLFMVDVGLLGALSGLEKEVLLEDLGVFEEFKGALIEQYVLQQIISDTEYEPYYYSSDTSTYEVDFLIQKHGNITPIEVKAAENVQAKSFKVFCGKYEPKYAVRLSTLPYKEQEWMTNIPLYAVAEI